jgi:hypothetical protein
MNIEIWSTKEKGKQKFHALVKQYEKHKLVPVKQIKDKDSLEDLFKVLIKESKATFFIYEIIHPTK